eukprot:CAMPEP_0181322656 /NCGR_PEP_ID=MMETSP1101-20121128/19345_1 /TAXON_ID=46948 /ORGANISM="Rhodomonas abbreviata, Strain Caron Lab Isolate" /LENGTH=539 /DNA_ID=CAMNT_0023430585 /DNA_START=37 /DNA_END=1656 /DNA_ORIENTATION=-
MPNRFRLCTITALRRAQAVARPELALRTSHGPCGVNNGLALGRFGEKRFAHAQASSGTQTITISKMSIDEWAEAFKKATIDLAKMDIHGISYLESAKRMRDLLKTGLLRHTDLKNNPERFFLAHRLLARHAPQLGPGFWIRFTVHYNLCAGTVLGLGTENQVKVLDEWQDQGMLGCFSLTEKLAGVNSGLVVNTRADWDSASQTFTLHSPNLGAYKNWISQGLVADKTVAVADLFIKGKSFGPHAFVMNLREERKPVPGVILEDMGRKTVGNDLDNAAIGFDKVLLPKDALLNRFADVEGDEYVQKVKGMPVFHMIGQRLFTGRVAVAQAALEFRRGLFDSTKQYAETKRCWAPKGEPTLSNVPQLKAIFAENDRKLAFLDAFVAKCEAELSSSLKEDRLPSLELVEAIAVAKVKAVEESIEISHRLQNEVGSYALMAGTGFEQKDFLTCCKFAEGDSRILMQKMVRDRLRVLEKKPPAGPSDAWHPETVAAMALASKLAADAKACGDKQQAWDDNWEGVYQLAEVIMQKTITSYMDAK